MRTCSTVSGSLHLLHFSVKQELDLQSIEDKSQNYNKLEMFFTEDSLQFRKTHFYFTFTNITAGFWE